MTRRNVYIGALVAFLAGMIVPKTTIFLRMADRIPQLAR